MEAKFRLEPLAAMRENLKAAERIARITRRKSNMFSHVTLGTNDFDREFAFYTNVMQALGHELRFSEPERCWAAWQQPGVEGPLFIVGRPHDGGPASCGNGQMVAFETGQRSIVDRCYQAAIESGGSSEGAPGLRPEYHPNYYGAYFRDPGGNKICVCCHLSEPKPSYEQANPRRVSKRAAI